MGAHNYFRQYLTSDGSLTWKDVTFVSNPVEGCFDGVIVIQSVRPLDRSYTLQFPEGQSLLAIGEPPDVLFLPSGYTTQFGAVAGGDWRFERRRIAGPAGYHWIVEVNIADFEQERPKDRLISAVVSNKSDTEGHKKRLKLMRALKDHFGERLDWFGRGIRAFDHNESERKLLGLSRYKYHIVLENGQWKNYWTEKLLDAYVSNCFPFYLGAPNIYDYFPKESLQVISGDDIAETIRIIENAISADRWAGAQEALRDARRLISDKYHPYELFGKYLNQLMRGPVKTQTIHPHTQFEYSLENRLLNRVWHLAQLFRTFPHM